MARRDERGTGGDPAWQDDDLTGGNDSGTAPADMDKGEPPDGPDETARITQAEKSSVAGSGRPGPRAPRPSRAGRCATGRPPDPSPEELAAERDEMAAEEPEPGVNEWGP